MNITNEGSAEMSYAQRSQHKATSISGNARSSINRSMMVSKFNAPQKMQQIGFEAIRTNLKRIFDYYCQFGERMNATFLKSHKYQKLAIDADILDSRLTKTKLELIFSSENKNKIKSQIDFENFLNSLVKVSEYKYLSNQNDILNKVSNRSNSALQLLLKNNLWPLYEKLFGTDIDGNEPKETNFNNEEPIMKNKENFNKNDVSVLQSQNTFLNTSMNIRLTTVGNQISNLVNIDELILNSQLESILHAVSPIMYDIYKAYFPWELSLTENENFLKDNSYKAYFQVLKEFDLCPSLISKSQAFQIYQSETITLTNDSTEVNEIYANILRNIEINPLGRSNNKNILGKYFTFLKFLKTICKIGDLGFEKVEVPKPTSNLQNTLSFTGTVKKLSSIEKICLGFERMEMSEGFMKIEEKTSKTHSSKNTFIIPKEILEKIKYNINKKIQDEEDYNNIIENEKKDSEELGQLRRNTKIRKSVLGNYKDLFEHTNYILERYGNQLNIVYKFFCSFGDPLNTIHMKTNKFSKFLKEAGLLRQTSNFVPAYPNTSDYSFYQNLNQNFGIKINEIDVIFFKLCGSSNANVSNSGFSVDSSKIMNQSQISILSGNTVTSGNNIVLKRTGSIVNSNARIDFNGFINAIELISLQLFPNKEELEAIDYVINNHILPLIEKIMNKNNNIHNEALFKEKMATKEFSNVVGVLYKSLNPLYKFYQNKNGLMTFDVFSRFCSDFSIFPDIISKSKLYHAFKNTTRDQFLMSESGENELIDQNIFTEIIAQVAFEIPYKSPEPDNIDKIILFVDKISQSDGIKKVIKLTNQSRLPSGESFFDIMAVFKQFYPDHFTIKQEKKVGFFDVLNNSNNLDFEDEC